MAYQELLRRIKERREALDISERVACERAGLRVGAIQGLRKGQAPSTEKIHALATALECHPWFLFEAARVDWAADRIESDEAYQQIYETARSVLELRVKLGTLAMSSQEIETAARSAAEVISALRVGGDADESSGGAVQGAISVLNAMKALMTE